MADDPRRLRALKNLTACFEAITVAGGYKTDIGAGHVFRGRRVYGDDDPLPLVAINDFPLPEDQLPVPRGGTTRETDWQLLVQGFVEDDRLNPSDPAHVLAADCQKALAFEARKNTELQPDVLGMGGLVTDIRIGAAVVNAPDEISSKAYFYMPVTLTIVEDCNCSRGCWQGNFVES
jgi:hypothetical protein